MPPIPDFSLFVWFSKFSQRSVFCSTSWTAQRVIAFGLSSISYFYNQKSGMLFCTIFSISPPQSTFFTHFSCAANYCWLLLFCSATPHSSSCEVSSHSLNNILLPHCVISDLFIGKFPQIEFESCIIFLRLCWQNVTQLSSTLQISALCTSIYKCFVPCTLSIGSNSWSWTVCLRFHLKMRISS